MRASVEHGLGLIQLDRPKALNALTPAMVTDLTQVLTRWADDTSVHTVVVRSTSARAFCAGGDICLVREEVRANRLDAAMAFFAAEYALNAQIASYPKPYVALLDGVAMGGGLGLSVHGSHRVVTQHSVLAMPETAIGFFPDVGASHFLPRLSPGWGRYLGLTGARVEAAGALRSGLATHHVPRESLDDLIPLLARDGVAALDAAHSPPRAPSPAETVAENALLQVFRTAPLADLATGLAALPEAGAALQALHAACPASLVVTDELLRLGAGDHLKGCLDRELATAATVIRSHDFDEGVRCALVDRGTLPQWTDGDVLQAAASRSLS
ncbi:enoyl-CoA hydratase/isomerase family protein [Streptomyces sp. 8L]|uniref:enoyl-CoA hydratase/isomerase family protein n=1 Tax=Streptomyces sp. 8L TaxID=2877242 RepID=UPI0027E038CB|nr:enoyl-CoA hydratase/isomerase family protein [Streptomyces sp. 8L]